jgi:hypothetical protein
LLEAAVWGLRRNGAQSLPAGGKPMKPSICNTNAWFPLAIGIGAAMGSATGDMGLWLSLGAGAGLAFGSGWRGRRR